MVRTYHSLSIWTAFRQHLLQIFQLTSFGGSYDGICKVICSARRAGRHLQQLYHKSMTCLLQCSNKEHSCLAHEADRGSLVCHVGLLVLVVLKQRQ